MTTIIKVGSRATTHRGLATLGAMLADGQLVAFPTETVYGIAARSDSPPALELLRWVKGRPSDRPFTVHLADPGDLLPLVAPPGPFVSRVVRSLWPGPLTLVLGDRQGGRTGYRLPDCEIARALFRAAGVGLVATSANLSGEPPLVTARQVTRQFKGKVAGILAAGRTRLAAPSTVARIEGRQVTVLRPGGIPAEVIHDAGCYDILFVCTGNLCRSPMAEALVRRSLAERLGRNEWELRGAGLRIHSAGVAGVRGHPATPEAAATVQSRGANLNDHFARPLTREMVRAADVIYTAEGMHADSILKAVPEAAGRIRPLDPDGGDIPDPMGEALERYREVLLRIENALEAIIERTLSESGLGED